MVKMPGDEDTNVDGKTDSALFGAITIALAIVVFIVAVWTYDGPVWEPEQLAAPVEEVVEEAEEEISLVDKYRFECQSNSIIAGAYSACRNNTSCGLSNDEMMIMYIAGKTAVIVCKKHEMLELFIGLNDEIRILEDLKSDDLPDEPEDKGDDEKSAMNL